MAHTKQTQKRSDAKGNLPRATRQPGKWGTAAEIVTHRPPKLPPRTDGSGNVSYRGMCTVL